MMPIFLFTACMWLVLYVGVFVHLDFFSFVLLSKAQQVLVNLIFKTFNF